MIGADEFMRFLWITDTRHVCKDEFALQPQERLQLIELEEIP